MLPGVQSILSLSLTKGAFASFTRTIVDFTKHYEPKHLRWQWTPRRCPKIECPDLCVPRKCPKTKFYQKRKKVPVDIVVCPPKKPKPRMTLRDLFSFIIPPKREKPPLATCRRLFQMRIKNCVDPFKAPECFRVECDPCEATEWYGQAVMRTRAYTVPPNPSARSKSCLPPSYIVPKTIMCPRKDRKPTIENPKPPFEEMLKDRARLQMSKSVEVSCLRQDGAGSSNEPCAVKIPYTNYKHKRLCQPKDKFKGIPCPHHLYQRYRSVRLLRKTKLTPVPGGYTTFGGYARWKIASVQPGILRGSCNLNSGDRSFHSGRMYSTDTKPSESPAQVPPEAPKGPQTTGTGEKCSFSSTDLARKVCPVPSTPEQKVVFIEQRMNLQPSKQVFSTVKLAGCSIKSSFSESDYVKWNVGPPIKFEYPLKKPEVTELEAKPAKPEQPPPPVKEGLKVSTKESGLGDLLKSRLSRNRAQSVNLGHGTRSFHIASCLGKNYKQEEKFSVSEDSNPFKDKPEAERDSCGALPSRKELHSTEMQGISWLNAGHFRLFSMPCKPGEGGDKGKPCPRRKNPCQEEEVPKKKKRKPYMGPCESLDPKIRNEMTKREPDPEPKPSTLSFTYLIRSLSSLIPHKLGVPLALSSYSVLSSKEALKNKFGFLNFSCKNLKTPKGGKLGKKSSKKIGRKKSKKAAPKLEEAPPPERKISPCEYLQEDIRKELSKARMDPEPKDTSTKFARNLLATSPLVISLQKADFSTNESQDSRGFKSEQEYIHLERKGMPSWEENLLVPKNLTLNTSFPGVLFFTTKRKAPEPMNKKAPAQQAPEKQNLLMDEEHC